MIVDYRKKRTEHAPILINGVVVEQVESFKFLGVHIANKLTWSLGRVKRFGMAPQILKGSTAAPSRGS
jgi:hypothetical protein